jgi:hypothetical protein
MSIDYHHLAQQLLERLANAIHDRDPQNRNFIFTIHERKAAESWIKETLENILEREL